MKGKTTLFLLAVAVAALFALWAANADAVLVWVKAWAASLRAVAVVWPVGCWLGMLALSAVAINCPIPVAALLKVLAGFAFGVQAGFALNVCTSVLGGLLGFSAARHWFYHWLYARFSARLARTNLEIGRNGFWYVLSARLLMATPFFLVNVLGGLSSLRKRVFLLGTLLGVLPSSMIYAVSGSQLERISSTSDFVSPRMALVLAGLALVSVLPALLNRRRKPARQASPASPSGR